MFSFENCMLLEVKSLFYLQGEPGPQPGLAKYPSSFLFCSLAGDIFVSPAPPRLQHRLLSTDLYPCGLHVGAQLKCFITCMRHSAAVVINNENWWGKMLNLNIIYKKWCWCCLNRLIVQEQIFGDDMFFLCVYTLSHVTVFKTEAVCK